VFSERERAALAWTEAVTLVADTHVPDDVYDKARAAFSEQELVDLTMAAVTINAWNRLMVSFRIPPTVARNT
jgi:alkylhydroperoxidase family enzyme